MKFVPLEDLHVINVRESRRVAAAWFAQVREAYGDHRFVLYKKKWGREERIKLPEDAVEVTYYDSCNDRARPQWVLFSPECYMMELLRNSEEIIYNREFDPIMRLCLAMYEWDYTTPLHKPQVPYANLFGIGCTMDQDPDAIWCFDSNDPDVVKTNLESRMDSRK